MSFDEDIAREENRRVFAESGEPDIKLRDIDGVSRIFTACLPSDLHSRSTGLGVSFDSYCAALARPGLLRRAARDAELAPIRLLIARREARALLWTLRFEHILQRPPMPTIDHHRARFHPPPWWSPLPESVTGVLRAWWRRRRCT